MKEFCKSLNIEKSFSSCMYSQSNGQVERAIGHIKSLIKRCKGNFNDFQFCLLDYHNTPLDSKIGSPFNILMGRSVKGRIPCLSKNLVTESDIKTRELLVKRQKDSAEYYNRTARKSESTVFGPGDIVAYRDSLSDRVWKQAKVVQAQPELRSYTLMNRLGNLITRNSKMMLLDNTGRSFALAPESFEPGSSTTPPSRPQPQVVLKEPPDTIPTASSNKRRVKSASTPLDRTPAHPKVVIPKATISPESSKMLKLRSYAEKHNTRVVEPTPIIRRSAWIAAKNAVN